MTQILRKVLNKINTLVDAFMQSKFMKAWEQAAVQRAQYYISKRAIEELQSMSDKDLRDLGLHRGEIYNVVMKAHKKA